MPGEADLSLGAELLLLSVDPGDGGLFPHKRRRMRKALRAAGSGRRRALSELRGAGLVERDGPVGRVRLVDRAEAGARFRRLGEGLSKDALGQGRDRDLAFLLAWTGVLGARLSAHERRVASRRIRSLAETAQRAQGVAPANAALSPLILALGVAATEELIEAPLGADFPGADTSVSRTDVGVGGGDPN